jgi:hypothetical protein
VVEETVVKPTDWTKCVLCQDDTTMEKLTKPENTKRTNSVTGYKSLANDLQNFDSVRMMPMTLIYHI